MKKMEQLTTQYLSRAETWLFITTLLYFLMNGAQIFETLVLVPKWVVSPPDNFGLLLDGQGVSLKVFWIVLHSIHELTFLLALYFCWKIEPVRNWLLILLVMHISVRAWTLSYFAPNIIEFQKIAETPALAKDLAKDLVSRTSLWQTLNYVRVSIYILISLGFIPLCIKLANMRH